MLADSRQLHNLDDLRKYVNETLCHQEQLELDSFPMTERILLRGDQPCGIFFCVHGPRALKATAIWETDRNTLLFYGSAGQRFQKTRLIISPKLVPLAA